jgi:tetratricopeptide (TPR) repeat protein
MTIRLLLIITLATAMHLRQTANAQTQLTTEQFMNAVTVCATGMNIKLSADILGSVRTFYEGAKTQGTATLQNETEFLKLFPIHERKTAYELYLGCIAKILGFSKDASPPPNNSACLPTFAQCSDDYRTRTDAAVRSCSQAVQCEPSHALAHAYLGHAHRGVGEYRAAESAYEQQLKLGYRLNDETIRSQALHNLGTLHMSMGALDSAESYLRRSLDTNVRLRNRLGEGATYAALGQSQFKRGNLQQSETHLQRALIILKELGDKPQLANAYEGLSAIALRRDDRQSACSYLRAAHRLLSEVGYFNRMTTVERGMQRVGCT